MRLTCLALLVLLAATIAFGPACGGATSSDLLAPSGTGGGGSGGGNGDAGNNGGGNEDSGGPDVTNDVNPGGGGDDVVVVDSTFVDSRPQDAQADAALDAGDAGPDLGIACGTSGPCKPPSQFCCVANTGGSRCETNANSCASGGTNAGTAVHCDDSAECSSGQVCCGTEVASSYFSSVMCQSTCTSINLFNTAVRFCDPARSDCPSTAPNCRPNMLLTGYNTCGP